MCFTLSRTSARKHPHVCGEDRQKELRLSDKAETPPRVWGRHKYQVGIGEKRGNTPTCVGKTLNDH